MSTPDRILWRARRLVGMVKPVKLALAIVIGTLLWFCLFGGMVWQIGGFPPD